MDIRTIYRTYLESLKIENATEYQKNQPDYQFLDHEISICGEIEDVFSYKTIVITVALVGYFDLHSNNHYVYSQSIKLKSFLDCSNFKIALENFHKGDKIQCVGKIQELKSRKGEYPYNIFLWLDFTILPTSISKIDNLWLTPEYFGLKEEKYCPPINSDISNPSKGCSITALLILVLVIAFLIL